MKLGFRSLAAETVPVFLSPSLCPAHLFLHEFELLLEPGVVPLLLQANPPGLVPAAHSVVLLHLLHLLLLLALQVLQLSVKELLLGLEVEEKVSKVTLYLGGEWGQDVESPELDLRPGLKSQLYHLFTV